MAAMTPDPATTADADVRQVLLAAPRGFCAGVEMAIKALTWMVGVFEAPVYCYHEIVHNASIVEAFEAAGVVFVDGIEEVPPGAPVMLSAHGSAPEVVTAATGRAAVMVDAVCPLVTKVHHEVKRKARDGFDIIYVGHEGHDEAVGTVAEAPGAITLIEPEQGLDGFVPEDPARVALVAQTTLGRYEWQGVLDAAAGRFPELWTARRGDLCYATTNRQTAVQELARKCDLVLVIGSANSSNTNALVRVVRSEGVAAHRVDDAAGIDPAWLDGVETVGVTSGASAPEQRVNEVVTAVAATSRHPVDVAEVRVIPEAEYFPLPPSLRSFISALQAAVEGAVSARIPGRPGPMEQDRAFSATDALDLLAT
jgi:4-hydroxy-3-methylbut-2-enyl diphosphate reductase